MAIPLVNLSVDLYQVLGTALPNARVALTLTRADIVEGEGIVPAQRIVIQCDAEGKGNEDVFPNAAGTLGTQYGVQVFSDAGAQVFPALLGEMARASLPDSDCQLHAVLFNIPPLSRTDADAAVLLARAWATKLDGMVDGQEYSAKHYATLAAQVAGDLAAAVETAEDAAEAAVAAMIAADEFKDLAQAAAATAIATAPHVGETPPADPIDGKEWFKPSNGKRYVWLADDSVWVESAGFYYVDDPVSVAAAEAAAAVAGGHAGTAGTQADIATAQAADATTQNTQATAAKVAAEAARDATNTTGKVFTAAEGTAAGIAATTNGQQFAVVDASLNFWIVYRNNAGVAAEVTRSYTKAFIDTTLGVFTDAFLPESVPPVSAAATVDRTFRWPVPMSEGPKRLQSLTMDAVAPGALTLGAWDATNTLVDSARLLHPSGLFTLSGDDLPDFRVPSGGYVSVYSKTGMGLTVGASSNSMSYQHAGGNAVASGGSPSWTNASGNRLEIGLRFGGASSGTSLRSELDELVGELADVRPSVLEYIGSADGFITGSPVTAARVTAYTRTKPTDEIVEAIEGYFLADTTLQLKVLTASGSTYTQVGDDVPVKVSAGLQTVYLDRPMIVRAGQLRGFYADANVICNGVVTNDAVLQDGYVDSSAVTGNVRVFTDAAASGSRRAFRFLSRPFAAGSSYDKLASQLALTYRGTTENAYTDTQDIGYFVIWMHGQSNGAGRAPDKSTKVLAPGHYKYQRSDTSLQPLADPTGNDATALAAGGKGSAGPAIAKMIEVLSRGRMRAIIVNSCEGGTTLTAAISPNWTAASTLRAQASADLSNALVAAATAGLRISGCASYLNIGETDASSGTTEPAYITAFQSYATWVRSVIGPKIPIIVMRTGRPSTGDTAGHVTIRGAQDAIAETEASVFMPHSSAVDFTARGLMADSLHCNLQAQEEQGDATGICAMAHGVGLRPLGYAG